MCAIAAATCVSTDGRTLFVPAAPGAAELRATGRASVVWVVDTSTLQRVAAVLLPEPAFDNAPSPDGSALMVSTDVAPPDRQTSWLLAVPSGREFVKMAAVGVLSVRIADAGSLTTAEELSLLVPMRPEPLWATPAVPTERWQFARLPAGSAGLDSDGP